MLQGANNRPAASDLGAAQGNARRPATEVGVLHTVSVPSASRDVGLRVDGGPSIAPPINAAMWGRDANGNYLFGAGQLA